MYFEADDNDIRECNRLDKLINTSEKRRLFLENAISDIFNGDVDNIIEFKRRIVIGSNPIIAEYEIMLSYLRKLEHRKKIKKAMDTVEYLQDMAYPTKEPFSNYAFMIK